jgi:hypothetical protein
MSSEDPSTLRLTAGLAILPVELKRVVFELAVGHNTQSALELAAKSSVVKQWFVCFSA